MFFESVGYYAPRAIYRLLSHDLRIKVATKAFHNADGKKFEPGTILLPLSDQDKSVEQIEFLIDGIVVTMELKYTDSIRGSTIMAPAWVVMPFSR